MSRTSSRMLGEICRPRQWPTLSKKDLTPEGYPVYGANGRIGFSPSFSHERPTLLIGCRGSCGTVHITEEFSYANGNAMALDELDEDIADLRYLYHYFSRRGFRDVITGTSQPQIIQQHLKTVEIPLPPLKEQRRIAGILDKARIISSLRSSRSRELMTTLELSLFLDLFGSPATNSKGWRMMHIGDLAEIFSDGPFGSNLKSSHYVDHGIRVIRLQNIGVREFADNDKAYISESHYKELSRNTCLPGDILIGTLGEPNLRACIQPSHIHVAINKADCVQMRCDCSIADPLYVMHLLNTPDANAMASSLILGQTRGRISMGRLRSLSVPVPPLDLQVKFASRIRMAGNLKQSFESSFDEILRLKDALSHLSFQAA